MIQPQHLIVLGGTGFVGSHLVPRLAADGHRVTVLSRNRELHRELAVVPGVVIRSVDVHADAALRDALRGGDAVINLIGVLSPTRKNSFQRMHVELPQRLIAACQQAGVKHLHQMSSLKAGQGLSQYLKTRGEAEALIKASSLDWTIYQPSVIFGPGDGLVRRFAALIKRMPLLPLARAGARLAPTYVGDVSEAIARCVANPTMARRKTVELYGPQVITLGELVKAIRDQMGVRRSIMALPDSLGRLQAQMAELLPGKPFSLDNFRTLRTDSVGKTDGYAALGILAQPITPWLPVLLAMPARQRRLDQARTLLKTVRQQN